MHKENIKCAGCRFKSGLVAHLSRDELCQLEKSCSMAEYKRGELIFKEGARLPQITYIRKGFVKLCKTGSAGKELILNIVKAGAFLGIQNVNNKNRENYFSAYALTETQVCFLDTDCFAGLLKQNGNFAFEVISYIFEDEMNYFDRLVNNVQQQLPGRLANALLYFRHQVYDQNPFSLNLTIAELASLIGTSRESVSRLIKIFRDDGLIETEKNNILILEEEKLEEIKRKG